MSGLFLSRLVSRAQSHSASPAGAAREDAASTEALAETSAESRAVDANRDGGPRVGVPIQGVSVATPARTAAIQDRVDREIADAGETAFERAAPAVRSTAVEAGAKSAGNGRQAARVHTIRSEPSRLTPRVDPVWPRGGAAERLARTSRTPAAGTSPDTIVRVNIGRVEVKAVPAPAGGERTKAGPDTKAIGLDEYLATRRGDAR